MYLLRSASALFAASFMFSSSSLAQSFPDGLPSGADTASIATGRRQPNMLPSAPTKPAGSSVSAAAWPTSAEPVPSYDFAGGRLVTGVTAATFYDDNIFATRTNRQSDVAFVGRPEFAWAAQGQNYAVGADGYIEGRRYANFSSEDQLNGSIGANFTVMPDSDTQVVGNARYLHGHLDRGSSETIGPGGVLLSTSFNKPIAYDQAVAALALNKRYGQWWTSLGAAGAGIRYENAALQEATVDFSYANGGTVAGNGRLGYVIAPSTSVFVEAAGNSRHWGVDAFNSNGYRVVGGVLFEQGPNARLRGEVWAGYMNQQYNGVSFETVSSWTYGASLAFLFTDKLTGIIEGKREAKEAALSLAIVAPGVIGASTLACSTTPGASCVSAIESIVAGRLEYRILPNLAIGGGASFMVDDYLGPVAGNRSDRTLSPLASLKYFASDKVTFGFDYRRINFDPVGGQSAGVGAISYYRNVYLLSMNGRF